MVTKLRTAQAIQAIFHRLLGKLYVTITKLLHAFKFVYTHTRARISPVAQWSACLSTTLQDPSSIAGCGLGKVHSNFHPFGNDKLSTRLVWELNNEFLGYSSRVRLATQPGHMLPSNSGPMVRKTGLETVCSVGHGILNRLQRRRFSSVYIYMETYIVNHSSITINDNIPQYNSVANNFSLNI